MSRNPYQGFRVRHACGHIMYYEHLLPPTEEAAFVDRDARLGARLRKLEWLEQRDCQSGYYKDGAEKRLDHLRQRGVPLAALPRLAGTEKQVSWARKLRIEKVDEIVKRYRHLRQQLAEEQRIGKVSVRAAAHRRRVYDQAVARIIAQTDAQWWIEQRAVPAPKLLRDAAISL